MSRHKNYIYSALCSLSKAVLEDIKIYFDVNIPFYKNKYELAKNLGDYFIFKPKVWLSKITERDIVLLRKLVLRGPDSPIYTAYPDYPSILETINIINTDESDGNFIMISINKDVYDVVAPYIEEVFSRNTKSGKFTMERKALGILNIYGVLCFDDFAQMLWESVSDMYPATQTGVDRFYSRLYNMPLVKSSFYVRGGVYYISAPFINDAEGLRKAINRDFPEISEYKKMDPSVFYASGENEPCAVYGGNLPEGEKVRQMLLGLGYSKEEVIREMHNIWFRAQCLFDENVAEDLLSCVTGKQEIIPSSKMFAECLKLVADYANVLPKWLLKGYSANDKNVLKVVLDNYGDDYDSDFEEDMDAMDDVGSGGFELPEPTVSEGFEGAMNKSVNLLKMTTSIPHVADNDPCPCGSGLRYKNCHGKYLS